MNKIEERLLEEREKIQSIQAPPSLEKRLQEALNIKTKQKKKQFSLLIAVAAIVLTFLISYNYNALAYYSKKILGFENYIFGTLRELNESGFGQPIDQRITFEDGTILTINGIISDENQLILFHTLYNENGLEDSLVNSIRLSKISGFLTHSYHMSGSGSYNSGKTELKMIDSFEPVHPFAKNLTLHIWYQPDPNAADEIIEISFKHDPNKAMRATYKLTLNETFEFDLGTITVKSLTASPTMTTIEGTIDMNDIDNQQFSIYDPHKDLILVANENFYNAPKSFGSKTSITGTTFDVRYDALPTDLHSLQLVMQYSTGYEEIVKEIDLQTQLETYIPMIDGREILINDIKETYEGIEITVATDNDLSLDKLFLQTVTGEIVPNHSIDFHGQKMQRSTRYMNESTYTFKTKVQQEALMIDGIYYKKEYGQTTDIPIRP